MNYYLTPVTSQTVNNQTVNAPAFLTTDMAGLSFACIPYGAEPIGIVSLAAPNAALAAESTVYAFPSDLTGVLQDSDVALNNVNASYLSTGISAKGNVAHKEGWAGKFRSLDSAVRDGSIQDILRLFVSEDRPPMSGVTGFHAHVTIPPEGRPFLKEVTLQADFEIGGGHFEKPSMQDSVDKLSETARGQKKAQQNEDENNPADNVISAFRGHVVLRNGLATFTDLSFTQQGIGSASTSKNAVAIRIRCSIPEAGVQPVYNS